MSTTRKEISERKTALLDDLRAIYGSHSAQMGAVALSQRELSTRYGLSMRTVGLEMQKLTQEGVLYTVPRVGTFVGRPKNTEGLNYVFLTDDIEDNPHWRRVQAAFEDRISCLGGSCFSMLMRDALQLRAGDAFPAVVGLFGFSENSACFHDAAHPQRDGWPFGPTHPFASTRRVVFRSRATGSASRRSSSTDTSLTDELFFDDEHGGVQATRHLFHNGHRDIAFLGLHAAAQRRSGGASDYNWSLLRQRGWKKTLDKAGVTRRLAILPPSEPEDATLQTQTACAAVERLLREKSSDRDFFLTRVSAVVTSNDDTARGLFQALQNGNVALSRWPSVVSFDDQASHPNLLSSLRLPWSELGEEAATLLWQRTHAADEAAFATGATGGIHEPRILPMRLIPRLTCRQGWPQDSSAQFFLNTQESFLAHRAL